MTLAFEELFGVTDGFGRIEFSGRTDLFILENALKLGGVEGTPHDHMDSFIEAYARLLPSSLAERDGHVMPGFPELLDALREAGAKLGLATGNFTVGSEHKLGYYKLADYFEGGGFGEVSLDRAEVVAEAIRVVADGTAPEDIIIVGDTPHDITAALANNVLAVGVGTGHYSEEDLRETGAHAVFADFSDWQAAAETILAL
jgi:phosphoglycolate phosphatase